MGRGLFGLVVLDVQGICVKQSAYVFSSGGSRKTKQEQRHVLARDINQAAELPVFPSFGDEVGGEEVRDGVGEVDAVDEDIDYIV
jgi:hypothetical protein